MRAEHPYRHRRRVFGYGKIACRGIEENTTRIRVAREHERDGVRQGGAKAFLANSSFVLTNVGT